MTTPDPVALREALDDANYRLEQGHSISPPYLDRTLFALAEAAGWALARIEGGKEVWWCETHDAQMAWLDASATVNACWLRVSESRPDCNMVKRLLVEP